MLLKGGIICFAKIYYRLLHSLAYMNADFFNVYFNLAKAYSIECILEKFGNFKKLHLYPKLWFLI